jgi:hypothetical protein
MVSAGKWLQRFSEHQMQPKWAAEDVVKSSSEADLKKLKFM